MPRGRGGVTRQSIDRIGKSAGCGGRGSAPYERATLERRRRLFSPSIRFDSIDNRFDRFDLFSAFNSFFLFLVWLFDGRVRTETHHSSGASLSTTTTRVPLPPPPNPAHTPPYTQSDAPPPVRAFVHSSIDQPIDRSIDVLYVCFLFLCNLLVDVAAHALQVPCGVVHRLQQLWVGGDVRRWRDCDAKTKGSGAAVLVKQDPRPPPPNSYCCCIARTHARTYSHAHPRTHAPCNSAGSGCGRGR